jgi:hypothetical protein
VRVAKPLGDSAACGALHVLTHVLEAAGELDHAVAVADQHVEKARKTGSPQRQFFAVRIQIDLAFARADRDGARAWLEEAAALARQLDGAAGGDAYGRQLRDRRARLEAEAPSRG